MVLKILLTVILAVVGFAVAARLSKGSRARARLPRKPGGNAAEQGIGRLAKCAKCGIYLPADRPCTCDAHG